MFNKHVQFSFQNAIIGMMVVQQSQMYASHVKIVKCKSGLYNSSHLR